MSWLIFFISGSKFRWNLGMPENFDLEAKHYLKSLSSGLKKRDQVALKECWKTKPKMRLIISGF
jgi:hypothetical protein